ncbi:unnamed protein product [Hermetia illucens]|uniref:MD-2-related lipid-recognition domain-containing protein n=1 Tax=Hermetia illucens TaxID=343691 RepID=A0A7R8UWP2_HERIL|nr:MD-2-related lipid-recognition protein-like [Hermetia illucens]CAD7088495.1 unnamed protein product [Hermetia illucens]
MKVLGVFAICALFGAVVSDVVQFSNCPNTVGSCKINEVRISPCPEAATGEACKFRRGRSAEIHFDFVPDFDSPTVEGRVFWASDIDLPLVGMETDACKFTSCPIVKGEKRSYDFTLPISRKFPSGAYDIKWRITGTNPEQQQCCFITKIKLTR